MLISLTKKFFLLCLTSVLSASCSGGSHDKGEANFHYIRLFDADFPIPLRYELISWDAGVLEYSSPAPLQSIGRSFMEEPRIGFIKIGPREMTPKAASKETALVELATCGSLEIYKVIFNEMSLASASKLIDVTLIIGKQNYIQITEQDTHLWRNLVKTYARLANIPPEECDLSVSR